MTKKDTCYKCPQCGSSNTANVTGTDFEDLHQIFGCGDCGFQEDAYEFYQAWCDAQAEKSLGENK